MVITSDLDILGGLLGVFPIIKLKVV